MNLKFLWDSRKNSNEVEIISHPANKEALLAITSSQKATPSLLLLNPKNGRTHKLDLKLIESISAFGHLSQVQTVDHQQFYLQKRIKELSYLEQENFFRINNSVILNLAQVAGFSVENYARLEVVTHSQNTYIVSRHYAKKIKERLL